MSRVEERGVVGRWWWWYVEGRGGEREEGEEEGGGGPRSSIDPACSQDFPARSSCWTLRVLTSAAQASHGSRQGGNLW